MVAPFVFCSAKPSGPQDHYFAIARGQRRFGEYMGSKHQPSFQQLGMSCERSKYIIDLSVSAHRLEHLALLIIPLRFGQWAYSWFGQPHVSPPIFHRPGRHGSTVDLREQHLYEFPLLSFLYFSILAPIHRAGAFYNKGPRKSLQP